MEETFLSRQYLESISTADLLSLADDYGIDIPSNLNRPFIIAELLETAEEIENEQETDKTVKITDSDVALPEALPESYNETQIHAILRNPAWVFVFWDIRAIDIENLQQAEGYKGLYLHVSFFNSPVTELDDSRPSDFFDVAVTPKSRDQYLLIPSGKKAIGIALKCDTATGSQLLAQTHYIEIPQASEAVRAIQPGQSLEMTPLQKLSGFEELVRNRYRNYRESFS